MTRARSLSSRSRQRGTVLLAALCFTLVLGLVLATYQAMCYYTLKTGNRNAWSARCIELAETGFEEALWSLNQDSLANPNAWNGWVRDAGVATKTVTGFNYAGTNSGEVRLTISNYSGLPAQGPRVITAEGFIRLADGTTTSRKLSVRINQDHPKAPLFTNAVAAIGTGTVNFNPTGSSTRPITVDSYDSTEATPEFKKTAIVTGGSVSLSDGTTINGYVATTPTSTGYVSLAAPANAKIIHSSSESVTTKIESSSLSTSPYQNVFDVRPNVGVYTYDPATSALGAPNAASPIVYRAENVTLSNGSKLTINGPVILVVTGAVRVNDTAQIVVSDAKDNDGKLASSLQIFVQGDLTVNGNGVINKTESPRAISIFGTAPDSQTFTFNTVSDTPTTFHGVLYAPKGNISVTGDGAFNLYGSMVGQNVAVAAGSAPVAFHYDLSLRGIAFQGIATPYELEVKSWQEITGKL
jgi:Tfp pilus assembly protein PilX